MALANAKLGAVHGIASVIGGMVAAPHGEVCARLLPYVMHANISALQSRNDASSSLEKYLEIAQRLSCEQINDPFESIKWVISQNTYFGIRALSSYGLTTMDIPLIVEKSIQASSTQGNPVKLTESQMSSILEEALG
jgi:alcohol dehydrogenase class IV